jgi:transposase
LEEESETQSQNRSRIGQKKTEDLTAWLAARRAKIESGKMVILFQDECHLLWGDVCGYVWGPRNERVEVPMTNERERQTYYGAVNLATGQCLVQPYARGNGEMTVEYLNYLISQLPDVQIVMIWDGAPDHRSGLVKTFLASVNQGLESEDWRVTCLQFAPNDPTQNPIEDIWLHAKRWLRECYHQCKTFASVKTLFELSIAGQIFDFPKLNRLGEFSLIS